jgi:formylglycine-generating enzyme required for sulfatase activity
MTACGLKKSTFKGILGAVVPILVLTMANPVHSAQNPAKRFTNALGMTFVYISAGAFSMGSPDTIAFHHPDECLQDVIISKGFYIQNTEVTQRQWVKVMGANPAVYQRGGDSHPVENISWNEAVEFIKRVREVTQSPGYRLPREAEWEYACRAGTTTAYAFGNCLKTNQANFDGSNPLPGCPRGQYRQRTVPVASFSPNAWGVFDMHGNVWEWCGDWYGPRASDNRVLTDPKGPETGRKRVIRGGSWSFLAHDCRSANRDRAAPHIRLPDIGLRLVFELDR